MPSVDTEERSEDCCPVCGGVWTKPKDLYVEDERVFYKGSSLKLTKQAHIIFAQLIKNQGRAVNKDSIWHNLYGGSWGRPDGGPDPAIINIYISHIRKTILEYDLPVTLETIWGVGWVFRRTQQKEVKSVA